MVRRPALVLLGCFALACDRRPTAGPAATAVAEPDAQAVVAEVAGATISLAELDDRIKEDLFRQATQNRAAGRLYETRSEALEDLIRERLVDAAARARGVTAEALLQTESGKAAPVADSAVRSYFDAHKDQLPDAEFDSLAPRIRQHLEQESARAAVQVFVDSLRAEAGVVNRLEPPRVAVAASGPSRGPAAAPVTIIEFSDYQCPYCQRAEPIVNQVLERFPEQVRFVYRHYPLERVHGEARAAAEAAACADDQQRFWEYHAALFRGAPAFRPPDLERYAEGVAGLDLAAFRSCVAERRFKDRVEEDVAAARAAGVSGTPAFFVNGIPLSGARDLSEFVEIIEGELAKTAGDADS